MREIEQEMKEAEAEQTKEEKKRVVCDKIFPIELDSNRIPYFLANRNSSHCIHHLF